ncbi:unnamed protein product [Phytomonas sp. Hart1]|nr:unnamed protein product [Phytomonas sp. Hart1]|eukprot:CCW70479.1 unnamed protein product [Phytomonas sp. isolate Hart1]
MLLLHHRMGYSIITLTESQRNLYKWANLEKYLLYKGQKYSSVNVLGRFCIILLIIYTFSTIFLAISMSTSSWFILRFGKKYESYSLFMNCWDQPLQLTVCKMYTLVKKHESFFPAIALSTGKGSAQVKYAFAMLGVSIFHIICQVVALFNIFWIAGRPTRSRMLFATILFLCLCVFAGTTNLILFSYSVQCEIKACGLSTQRGRGCELYYGWGYRLYSALIGINTFCVLMSICMYSYIYMISQRISAQLEGHRGCRYGQEAAQRHIHDRNSSKAFFDGDNDTSNTVNNDSFITSTEIKTFPTQANATLRDGKGSGCHLPNTNKNFNTSSQSGGLAHSPLYSSQNLRQLDGAQNMGNPSQTRFRSTKSERNQMRVFFLNEDKNHFIPNKESHMASDTLHCLNTTRALSEQHLDTSSSLLGSVQGKEALHESALCPKSRWGDFFHKGKAAPFVNGRHTRSEECQITNSQHNDCDEQRYVRKHRSAFAHLFRWDSDPDYITAAELGVQIDGANDWVYHDRSDMYYSFERNMFWDPLTHEYYNCALKCWQETPEKIVHTCMLETEAAEKKRRRIELKKNTR